MASTVSSWQEIGSIGLPETPAKTQGKQEVSKEAFMQLLVAQIKNQNPLNPADGVEFLTQLAQFSELEQLVNINTTLSNLETSLKPADPEQAS